MIDVSAAVFFGNNDTARKVLRKMISLARSAKRKRVAASLTLENIMTAVRQNPSELLPAGDIKLALVADNENLHQLDHAKRETNALTRSLLHPVDLRASRGIPIPLMIISRIAPLRNAFPGATMTTALAEKLTPIWPQSAPFSTPREDFRET
jgi:hypothetical protein